MPAKKPAFGKPRKKKAQEPQRKYKCPECGHQEDNPESEYGVIFCGECKGDTHINSAYIEEQDTTPESITPPAELADIDTRTDEERAVPAEEAEPAPAPAPAPEPGPEPEPEPALLRFKNRVPTFRIQRKPRTEQLPVNLTDEERLAYGKEMADLLAEAEQIDRETKQFKKAQDSKLAVVEAKLSARSIAISNGYEYRNVSCEEVKDYENFEVYTLRLDTYETVTRRKMTNDERQMQLTAE